jgi:hypothetical protein
MHDGTAGGFGYEYGMARDPPHTHERVEEKIERLYQENMTLLIELAALDAANDEIRALHDEWMKKHREAMRD